jgi:hypothetical protein
MQFFFADHTLDTDRRELRRGSEHIAVEPQVFDLLSGRGARGMAGMCGSAWMIRRELDPRRN